MFWFREIAGWSLVVFALVMLYTGLGYVTNLERPKVVEATAIMFAALGVMRAGIMLIRLSTAARICQTDRTGPRAV
ncbi:MAG: hypothetical protein JSS49_08100 [Planctomycetes bacterium]|nr:hypothetical protein [Planctomycetota bacterium]